jgi:cobaltochelatase CobN
MNDTSHGPDHVGTGCPTCDPRAGQLPVVGPRLATVKLTARGEDFRIVQLQGQLLVCARQHGSCCCGWDEKGRMPFDPQTLWGDEWERRKIRNRVHLSFTGCLGPCAVGNNALLLLHGHSSWLKDLNQPDLALMVYNWIGDMLAVGHVLPPPDRLRNHVYDRFSAPPERTYETHVTAVTEVSDGLDRLDPVCLMDVDPATSRHTVEYAGRTIAFCAPSCKKQFLADPSAYVTA